MYRQGDVLIIPTDDAVTGKPAPRENGAVILAHGEATGHAHAIHSRRATLFRPDDSGSGGMMLSVKAGEPVKLVHEEHATIMLPPGNYHVRRQREYSPEAIRNVAD